MESIVIPVASMKSASDALLNRISHAAIKPGEPIFRPVDQHQHIGSTRLTDRSVSNIIKARVLRYARKNGNTKTSAKAMAAGFSGHSLRAGFVTTAARSKVPGYHIRQHTRHKSVQTVERYIREADKLTDLVLKSIGFLTGPEKPADCNRRAHFSFARLCVLLLPDRSNHKRKRARDHK